MGPFWPDYGRHSSILGYGLVMHPTGNAEGGDQALPAPL